METESLSVPATKKEENKKLEQNLIALERDYKIFQDSKTGLRSRRFSIEGSNPIAQIFETSPRTLMSSLQNRGSRVERERETGFRFKGRSLLGDFEDAVEVVSGTYEIEKQGICDGSCSGSCLSEESFGGTMREKVKRDECRRGLGFKSLFFMGLFGIIMGLIYMMSFGVDDDEEVMILPT